LALYEYECQTCKNIDERIYPMTKFPKTCKCSKCGEKAKKLGRCGGIQRDEPTWLDDAVRGALQDTDNVRAGTERPIETRTDLKRYIKEHNLVATG